MPSFLLCEDKCGRDGMICINKKNETWRKTNEQRFPNLYQKFNVLEILPGQGGMNWWQIKIAIADRNDDGFWEIFQLSI